MRKLLQSTSTVQFLIAGGTGKVGNSIHNYLKPYYNCYILMKQSCGIIYKVPNIDKNIKTVVLYCSSLTPHNSSFLAKERAYSRLRISSLLKEICFSIKDLEIIYFSSISVYDISDPVISLSSSYNLTNSYGLYKLEIEVLCQRLCNELSLKLTIIRLPAVLTKSSNNSLVKSLSLLASNRRLSAYNLSRFYNACISIPNLISCIQAIVKKDWRFGCFNLCSTSSMKFRDILFYSSRLLRAPRKIDAALDRGSV